MIGTGNYHFQTQFLSNLSLKEKNTSNVMWNFQGGWIFWLPNCWDLLPKYPMNLCLVTKAISKLLVTQHVVEPWSSNLDDLGRFGHGLSLWKLVKQKWDNLHINWCKPTGFLKHQPQSHKPVLLSSLVRTCRLCRCKSWTVIAIGCNQVLRKSVEMSTKIHNWTR